MKKKLLPFLLLLLLFHLAQAQNPVAIAGAVSKRASQPGSEISKAYDGNPATLYHSNYSINAIPDTVDFYFVGAKSINKIDYTPRPSGTNGIWTTVDVYYATADNPNIFVSKLNNISWAQTNTAKTIDMTASPIVKPYIVRFIIRAAGGNFSSCGEINFSSAESGTLTSADCESPTADLDVYADLKIQPTAVSGTVTNGTDRAIGYAIDGNMGSFYMSSYSVPPSQGNPVLMNFDFTGSNSMDYMKYYPRTDGGTNGDIGTGEIWYTSATQPTLTKLMNFNAGLAHSSYTFTFPSALQNVTKIVFKVFSGVGNAVNCAEMEFHRSGQPSTNLYTNIFADDLHATLKPTVTQTDINGIASAFFKSLAQCIFNNTYNRKYRVQSYDFYPNTATVEGILKTSGLNKVENPTGIAFKANTTAVVFVGATSGVNPKLIIKDFALDNDVTTDTYPLLPGMNIINVLHDGLAYISYYSDNANLQPIQINIATGNVNGCYNPLTDTDSEWTQMLLNSTYPKLDIKGTYVNLNINKDKLFNNSMASGKALTVAYDTIVHTEYIQNGLVKYNRVPKNHMFISILPVDGNPFAGNDGVVYKIGAGSDGHSSASAQGVLYDPWGFAHEFGHNNQVRPGAKWIGMTEVTNNINSAWVEYNYGSRYPNSVKVDKQAEVPKAGATAVIGGRYGLLFDYALIQKKHLQTPGHSFDAYISLIPFWQLELYYQVAGACKDLPTLKQRLTGTPAPVGQPDVAYWYADVLEKMRTTSQVGVNDGQLILNFVEAASDAVHENLTDFFVKSGYLLPIDADVSDYGTIHHMTITQAQVDALNTALQAKGYPKPVSPVLNYISVSSLNTYKNRALLTGTAAVGVTVNTGTLTIDNSKWANAVAFETYNQNTLTDVAVYGTGSPTSVDATTTVQYGTGSTSVYAVGFDGTKKLVYPAIDAYNVLPTVAITSPANNAVLPAGSNITINADATDTDGIAKVEFYQGSTLLGQDLTAPYSFVWNNVFAGSYGLTAKATDNLGAVKTSSLINITVNAAVPNTFAPVADAFVRDGSYAGSNYGVGATLEVKKDGTSYSRVSYLRFDYSSFIGSTVSNTKLRVYVSAVGTTSSRAVSVYGITNTTWGETTINWTNQPTETGTLLGNYTINNTVGVWYELDVTSYINSQLALGNKIVSFRLVNEGAVVSTNNVSFNSRDAASNKPELVLTQGSAPQGMMMADSRPSTGVNTLANGLVDAPLALKVTAWPNPSTYEFKVQTESGSDDALQFRVYNVAQQLVKQQQSRVGETLTFGSELPSGVYLVEVKQGTQRKVVKVVKL